MPTLTYLLKFVAIEHLVEVINYFLSISEELCPVFETTIAQIETYRLKAHILVINYDNLTCSVLMGVEKSVFVQKLNQASDMLRLIWVCAPHRDRGISCEIY